MVIRPRDGRYGGAAGAYQAQSFGARCLFRRRMIAKLLDDAEEAQLCHMVDRFLCWKLPHDFHPDAGIEFRPTMEGKYPGWWPIGTNLLTVAQAREIVIQ